MSRLSIRLLGEARASVDGVDIQVDTRKAIALLAWLAVTGRDHPREALATLFWPDADGERARAALRRTLSTLSKALAGRWLTITRERVGLDDDGVELDVARFDDLLAQNGERRHTALHEAVALYRGDFMAGFSLRDSPEFDDWQRDEADRLRSAFGLALDRLAMLECSVGDWSAAIGHARRRLALDPLHEAAQRQLMAIYAWSGDRSAALRQYRECVRILDRELGVAPLEETIALYHSIQEQQLEPLPVSVPPPAPVATVVSIDQPDHYPLVGREQELALILDTWEGLGADGHLIVVEGEIGVGKSQLVDAIVAEAKRRERPTLRLQCYEGETQLAFGPVIDGLRELVAQPDTAQRLSHLPETTTVELARLVPRLGVGLQHPPSPLDNPGAQANFFSAIGTGIRAALSGERPGLLIVDDAHWIDDASLDLLGFLIRRLTGRSLLLLVTWSTELVPDHHRLRQITEAAVQSGTGQIMTLSRLNRTDIQQLAEQTAHELGIDADVLGERLYRESEGLPFFAVEYLREIRRQGLPIDDERWPLPAGPRALLQRRIAGLSETETQVLATLAAVGRTISLDLLRDTSGRSDDEVVTALDGLLAHGIVAERAADRDPREPVYVILHDRLRDVVYESLSLTRRRLLHRRIAFALQQQSRPGPAAQIAQHLRLAGLDREAADAYRAAGEAAAALYATSEALDHFESALALGHPEAATLHERIGDLRTLRGDYAAALTAYETAAAQLPSTARIEHKLGNLQQRMGAWSLALHHYSAAEPLYRQESAPDSQTNLARLMADWSLAVLRTGDATNAAALGQQARQLAEAVDNPSVLAKSDNLLGILARTTGDLDRARQHFEAALEAASRIGEQGIRIAALNNLARVLQGSDASDQALAMTREALALSVAHGDRHHEAALHSNLADLLHAIGQIDEAHDHLRASATIYAEVGVIAGQFQPEIWKLSEW